MSTTATTASQHVPLSRFAKFGTFGFKSSRAASTSQRQPEYGDAADDEWYIPYTGPYEQPKEVAPVKRDDRDSWAGLVVSETEQEPPHDGNRGASAMGYGTGGASTSGHSHRHGHGYNSSQDHGHAKTSIFDDRERGRVHSPVSKYSESVSTFGAGGDRHSHTLGSPNLSPSSPRRAPAPSLLHLETNAVGIGASPIPTQRLGHASVSGHVHDGHHDRDRVPPVASPSLSTRESLSSFWTFGRTGSKKSPPLQPGVARPSVESTSTRHTGPTAPTDGTGMRARSATVNEHPSGLRPQRPRANTATFLTPTATSPPIVSHNIVPSVIEPETASSTSSYQRHPYASALPPTGHRQHSQLMQPPASAVDYQQQYFQKQQQQSTPPPNTSSLAVPFLSPSKSITSLRKSTKNLKSSISTPNLRGSITARRHAAKGSSSTGAPSTPSASSNSSKWLSAETWCDALLFPRPRFRMRTAHPISPPESPTEPGIGPPHSAPPQTQQSRTRKRSFLGVEARTNQQTSSAPPMVPVSQPTYVPQPPVTQPEAGPSRKPERPPRPRSYAQDDLALASPVPSLATVLRQNEEFDRERMEWKARAKGSFGNKRSRSLSKSRTKGRLKQQLQDDRESELATSFGMIAASAFTGNQTLKPTIHFADNAVGTRTTGTGVGTVTNTASSHSRNASGTNASNSGHGPGHSRKESWSKTAIRTAKSTAHVAGGLCNFNQDLSPADEKRLELETAIERDRTKQLKLDPRTRADTNDFGDDVVVISPQKGATLLSPVPSQHSYESAQSGVGIAVSTPTALIDSSYQFSGHPFASSSTQSDSLPRSFDYAGPHPSRMADHGETSLEAAEVRHHMHLSHPRPIHLHPSSAYDQGRTKPAIRVTAHSISPSHKMFADVPPRGIREIYPDEFQYSPYSSRHPGSSGRNSESLGVEEALSVAFSQASSEGHGEDDGRNYGYNRTESMDSQFSMQPKGQELVAPPVVKSTSQYRGMLMPQIDEVSARESWHTDQNTPDMGIDSQVITREVSSTTPSSTFQVRRSPGAASISSSPMTSPRHFKKFDDMEDYSDIFYRPGSANGLNHFLESGQPTPTNEFSRPHLQTQDSSGSSDRVVLARSNSALTRLKRQLSQKYVQSMAEERQLLGDDIGLSRHVDENVVDDGGDIDEAHAMMSQGSSPPGATLPLKVASLRPDSLGPAHLIPEDVDSTRASWILDRFDGEGEEGTEVEYRVGSVPALATPPVHEPMLHRVSAHGSYIDAGFDVETAYPSRRASTDAAGILEEHEHEEEPEEEAPRSEPRHNSQRSLKPPVSRNSTRASYLTSTSSSSHISNGQLADFPSPPGPNSLTPGAIISSYFSTSPDNSKDVEERQPRERMPTRVEDEDWERRKEDRASRRTTFGPIPYETVNEED